MRRGRQSHILLTKSWGEIRIKSRKRQKRGDAKRPGESQAGTGLGEPHRLLFRRLAQNRRMRSLWEVRARKEFSYHYSLKNVIGEKGRGRKGEKKKEDRKRKEKTAKNGL